MKKVKPVALITGGSSGIGKALCKEFGKNGFYIFYCGRNQSELEKASYELKLLGIEHDFIRADVSSEQDCKTLIEFVINKTGRIDLLINNAGISMRGLVEETSVDVFKMVMDINFWGTVYCTKLALPYILQSNGTVIGISSIAGFIGLPARSAYSASKFAMHGFLQSLRIENPQLHVMIACPGFTSSNIRKKALNAQGEMQGESPLEEDKIMSAEEVANRIYKAYKKRIKWVIMTKEGIMAVWLSKFFPSLTEKLVRKKFEKEKNSPLRR